MRNLLISIITLFLIFTFSCVDKYSANIPCNCETCYDGIKNQNESDIDCGGVCAPCGDSSDVIIVIDTTFIYDTVFNNDTIIIADTIYDTVYYSDTYTITIQPDGDCGKDAVIHSLGLFTNGNYEHIWAATWTWNSGNWGIMRSLLGFDLSMIPQGRDVIIARLSLYGKIDPPDQHSLYEIYGTYNFGVIRRVTEEWDEGFVSWEDQPMVTSHNQVFIPPSNVPYEDYIDIDVTKLVQDILQNPSNGHGFMITLHEEEVYRMLAFCSSDNVDPERRPKLVITYKLLK